MRRAIALFLLVAVAAGAEPITKPLFGEHNDPRQAVHIVMTGDGWQDKDEGAYDAACQKFVSSLFASPPYQEYAQYFRFTSRLFFSEDHGCRREFPDGKLHLLKKQNDREDLKTVYGIRYVPRSGVRLPDVSIELGPKTLETVKEVVGDGGASMVIMITPDDDLSGGVNMKADEVTKVAGKMGLIVMTTDDLKRTEDVACTLAHELGHAVFGLADEYAYGDCFIPPVEPDQANVTINRVEPKWQGLIDRRVVGAPVQGGMYCGSGIYRPTANCRMRDLGVKQFCPVCRTRMAHAIAERSSMIKSSEPAGLMLSGDPATRWTFRVKTSCVEPGQDRYDGFFEVDGRVRDARRTKDSSGDVFELTAGGIPGFGQGSHRVRFNILDHQPDMDFPNARKLPTIANYREWWLDVKPSSALVPAMTPAGSTE